MNIAGCRFCRRWIATAVVVFARTSTSLLSRGHRVDADRQRWAASRSRHRSAVGNGRRRCAATDAIVDALQNCQQTEILSPATEAPQSESVTQLILRNSQTWCRWFRFDWHDPTTGASELVTRWTRHRWRVHCRVFSLLWPVHRVTTSPCDDFTVTSYTTDVYSTLH